MKTSSFFLVVLILCISFLPSYSQKSGRGKSKITVSGIVFGADLKAISGAFVFIDSKGSGVTTDENGKFKIKADPNAVEIMVAAPGKGFSAKPVSDKLEFVLDNPTANFPDFAVRYIEENKSDVKHNKAKKMNTYTDIYEMIRHEVPGVLVNGKSIVVQQQNSFFGSASPLYVVNGVRVTSIDYINPREVKSIQLLKGSYANIYGDEGANGVISITLISGGEK
jgi:hypothetical protein